MQKPVDLGRHLGFDQFAIQKYPVRLYVDLCAQLDHLPAVNGKPAFTDPLLRLAAAGYPQLGEPLL